MARVLSLPLASDTAERPAWSGLRPTALDAPEPDAPQGEYAGPGVDGVVPPPPVVPPGGERPVELLAPAGGPDAAFAAFQYGADAIYLGLKKFSARAEAENFTLEEVAEITAYAHSLDPARRVFVTINTLIRQDEMAELAADLAALAEIGVDAIILQDLGVYRLLRRHFPGLEPHASTQLAVHSRAGAQALRRLGFARVVLARELTFEEVEDITAAAGLETEVFIHGALCYSYSGLCLFSSQTLGRSGNRGKCAYSCRDAYEVSGAPLTLRDGGRVKRDPRRGFPFSMKDLALPDHLPALRQAGVSCFKIEGRKKSPLYVATATSYYRQLLDGALSPAERPEREAELQTVFSRPWTRLFMDSHKDKEVADRDTVGHRGAVVGKVETIRKAGRKDHRLRFRTARALERHDGLQIDLPTLGQPFGFPIDHLWRVGKKGNLTEAYEAPAGSIVEVGLPPDHPEIPEHAPVYCSSSQAVKRRYRHARPRTGEFHARRPVDIRIRLGEHALEAAASLTLPGLEPIQVEAALTGPLEPARDPAATDAAIRRAFERLGDTPFLLGALTVENPAGRFVPASRLNPLRRQLVERLNQEAARQRQQRLDELLADALPPPNRAAAPPAVQWSIKIDRLAFINGFQPEDWNGVEELVIDIARDHPAELADRLEQLRGELGPERIRLALPAITRKWEEGGIVRKIDKLRGEGWRKWEAANLSAWTYLGLDPRRGGSGLDLSTDWTVYVVNRQAALEVLEMGGTRFALSPEDGLGNLQSLLSEFADRAVVIVYQDTPQFLAESCAYANLIGGCPGKANCRFESMEMVSSHGEKVLALDYHCRTIVLNQGPYCLSDRLADLRRAGATHLRADFVYRPYDAATVRERWRAIRRGESIPGGHAANFDRGLL